MTLSRKVLLFLFSGIIMLQVVGFFIIALLAQRLQSALDLLGVTDYGTRIPALAGVPTLSLISTGSFLIGLAAIVILAVFLYEMKREGFSLSVDFKQKQ